MTFKKKIDKKNLSKKDLSSLDNNDVPIVTAKAIEKALQNDNLDEANRLFRHLRDGK